MKHLVEIADLEHENMLRLRLLQLRPLVDQAALRGLAAFDRAAEAFANEISPQETRAKSPQIDGSEQQQSHHEVRFRAGAQLEPEISLRHFFASCGDAAWGTCATNPDTRPPPPFWIHLKTQTVTKTQ